MRFSYLIKHNFSSVLYACGKKISGEAPRTKLSESPFGETSKGFSGLDAGFVSMLVPAALDGSGHSGRASGYQQLSWQRGL